MSFQLAQERQNLKENKAVSTPVIEEQPQQQIEAQETVAEQQEMKQEEQQPVKQDKSLENNIRTLREKSEKIARERDELARRVQELESLSTQKQEEDINIAHDDLVEGKHIKQVTSELKQLKSHLAEITVKNKLQSSYPDFESVVTPENVNALRENYPELAATIAASSDLYSKAVSAYTMIKKMGILPDKHAEHQKELVDKNANKPRPLTSIAPQQGDSPLSHANAFANGLTETLKEQLRKEMFAHRKSF